MKGGSMAVRPETLDNQERGLELTTREDADGKAGRRREDPAVGELKALRERIAAVLAAEPKDEAPHCSDCFRRGWKAGLRGLEG
jgi:hypothetical protein